LKKNIIIHIPHSSLKIPECFNKRLLIDRDKFNKENIFISDYLVDKFVSSKCKNVLKFNYSRLFCDTERFLDDELEVMSKVGMCVVYTKDSDGYDFVKIDNKYRNQVISNYYLPFHKLIDDTVYNLFNEYGKCYFIDLHSFSDEFVSKVLNKDNNPDICIGFEEGYIDKDFLDYTINFFKEKGYSVNINYPYSGTFIPDICFENHDIKVNSIMIEINKRVYLDDNVILNKNKFEKLKICIDGYLDNI